MAGLIERTRVPLAPAPGRAPGIAPGVAGAAWSRLDFAIQHQLQTQWCWAAVSASLAGYYEARQRTPWWRKLWQMIFGKPKPWTQCRMVCEELGIENCCDRGGSPECNRPWYLERALRRAKILGRLEKGAPLDLHGVRGEIESNRPVGARVAWRGGGGHVLVIEGCSASGDAVALEDPWYGSSDVPVAALGANGYQGSGSWTHIYFTRPDGQV